MGLLTTLVASSSSSKAKTPPPPPLDGAELTDMLRPRSLMLRFAGQPSSAACACEVALFSGIGNTKHVCVLHVQ